MIITFGGRAGSGTSSVGRAIARKLGYKFYSAGDIRRKLARDKGITLAELNVQAKTDSSSDKLVDDEMKRMNEKEDNLVIDAWVGFHFFPDSLKVFLDADIAIRAERLLERKNFEEHPDDVNEAVGIIKEREAGDEVRFEKLYGLDIFDPNHFDLVLDTTGNSVDQTVDQVFRFISSKIKK